jgi:hypothetical protein
MTVSGRVPWRPVMLPVLWRALARLVVWGLVVGRRSGT